MNKKFLSIICCIVVLFIILNVLDNKIFNKCILCNSRDTQVFSAEFCPFIVDRAFKGQYHHTKFVHCSNCNFNYSLYRPTESELADLYYDFRGEEYQKLRSKYEHEHIQQWRNKTL